MLKKRMKRKKNKQINKQYTNFVEMRWAKQKKTCSHSRQSSIITDTHTQERRGTCVCRGEGKEWNKEGRIRHMHKRCMDCTNVDFLTVLYCYIIYG